MTTFDIDSFEECAKENGQRYWDAIQFMELLGYESWASFKTVIHKSMSNCLSLGIDTEDIFIPVNQEDGSRSYKLTRFACFLIAMQADSKKPEVAKAQIALAALAETLLEEKLSEKGITRIEERGKLTSAKKHLGGIAKSAGLATSLDYAMFKDAGFRGMYNMSLKDLQKFKGVECSKTLYDFMGITELAANTFRVTQTAERMKKNNVKGLNQSTDALATFSTKDFLPAIMLLIWRSGFLNFFATTLSPSASTMAFNLARLISLGSMISLEQLIMVW